MPTMPADSSDEPSLAELIIGACSSASQAFGELQVEWQTLSQPIRRTIEEDTQH